MLGPSGWASSCFSQKGAILSWGIADRKATRVQGLSVLFRLILAPRAATEDTGLRAIRSNAFSLFDVSLPAFVLTTPAFP